MTKGIDLPRGSLWDKLLRIALPLGMTAFVIVLYWAIWQKKSGRQTA